VKRIPEELQVKLWPYMAGIAQHHGFEAIKVGGIAEFIEILKRYGVEYDPVRVGLMGRPAGTASNLLTLPRTAVLG
jgi:hypothetical protein